MRINNLETTEKSGSRALIELVMIVAALVMLMILVASCGEYTGDEMPGAAIGGEEQVEIDTWEPEVVEQQGVGKRDVLRFVERWVDAQNRNDLDAYAGLYHSRFEGVESTWEKTEIYDRSRWVASRRALFGRPINVEVRDIEVATADDSAVVYFVQRVDDADRSFEGPKELVVVESDRGLRIRHEEFLETTEIPEETTKSSPNPADLAMVLREGNGDREGTYMVLDAEPDRAWFSDGMKLLGYQAARAGVAADELPDSFYEWEEREVEIFDAQGRRCTGTVVGLYGLARVIPDFEVVSAWDGDWNHHGNTTEPLGPDEVAAKLWEQSNGPALVAEIELTESACEDLRPVWGRAEGSDTEPLRSVELGKEDEELLIDALRDEERYRALQRELDDSGFEHEGTWSTYGGASPQVMAYQNDEFGRTYAAVVAKVGEGCGDFEASMWTFYEVRSEDVEPRLVRLSSDNGRYILPTAMVDAGLDGIPAVIGGDGVWSTTDFIVARVGMSHQIVAETGIDYYGCGC